MTKFTMETHNAHTSANKESSRNKITTDTMLITFLHIKHTVHFEFVIQELTVDQAYIWKC